MSSGSSWTVTPPVNRVASSSAGHRAHPVGHLAREQGGHLLGAQPPLEHPLTGVVVLERLGQQVVEQQHLDAAPAHHLDERVELLLGAAHPDHVVEQELVAVGRREALVRQVGAVDDHRAQRPDLRVGADRRCGYGFHIHSRRIT